MKEFIWELFGMYLMYFEFEDVLVGFEYFFWGYVW